MSGAPLVIPGYLSRQSLPYASDIFYHQRIVYCLPTGFHPIEIQSVAKFPEYCRGINARLPRILWQFCKLYFENARICNDCIDILAPLKAKHLTYMMLVYPRHVPAIERSVQMLTERPDLREILLSVDLDMRFVAREVGSHLFFEPFLEGGYGAVMQVVQRNCASPDDLLRLVCAVLVNRLSFLTEVDVPVLLYDHSWHKAILAIGGRRSKQEDQSDDVDDRVEHFAYKLFESVVLPLYGRCDSKKRCEEIAETAERYAGSITTLKEECHRIAREIVVMPVSSEAIRTAVLKDRMRERITEPLEAILRQPRSRALRAVQNVVVDSTVIGGLLAVLQSPSVGIDVAGLAVAAGGISTGIKYLLDTTEHTREEPGVVLIEGLRRAGMAEEEFRRRVERIGLGRLEVPKPSGSA
jgi:hypothetical protein